MKRIWVVFNCTKQPTLIRAVAEQARQKLWGYHPEFFYPDSVIALQHLCASIPEDVSAVALVGGDGTFNRALVSLMNQHVVAFPFPAGTANDLAAGLHLRPCWELVQDSLNHQRIMAIDVIQVNEAYFTTVGGIGLGASLTQMADQLRARSRLFSTLWKKLSSESYGAMATQLIMFQNDYAKTVQLRIADQSVDATVATIMIANQPFLGGNILVAPDASPTDGLFDVVTLEASSRIELLRSMIDAKRGKGFAANRRFQAKECVIQSIDDKPILVFGDGEPLLSAEHLHFKVLPKRLRVLTGPAVLRKT